MSKEKKETWFRNSYGGYKEWVSTVGILLLAFGIVVFVIGSVAGVIAIGDKYEVRAFNRIHGTDYTWAEWFWAQQTIKQYHLGTVENKNYQVDLNIKKEAENNGT